MVIYALHWQIFCSKQLVQVKPHVMVHWSAHNMYKYTTWSADQSTTCQVTRHGLPIRLQHVKSHVMVCWSVYNMSSHMSWPADQLQNVKSHVMVCWSVCNMSSHMSWSADQSTCQVTCHGLLISIQNVMSHVMVCWSAYNRSSHMSWSAGQSTTCPCEVSDCQAIQKLTKLKPELPPRFSCDETIQSERSYIISIFKR